MKLPSSSVETLSFPALTSYSAICAPLRLLILPLTAEPVFTTVGTSISMIGMTTFSSFSTVIVLLTTVSELPSETVRVTVYSPDSLNLNEA